MGPFDFLHNIANGLTQYFQPGLSDVSDTLKQFFPSKVNNLRMDASPKAPNIQPSVNAFDNRQQQYVSPLPQGAQTPNMLPGENAWVQMQQDQMGSPFDQAQLHDMYLRAMSAPGGHPYIPAPTSSPIPMPSMMPSPMQMPNQLPSPQDFQAGFQRFGAQAPVAQIAPAFAQAAAKLPRNVDPYLPAIIALMETGGGAHLASPNNAFNLSTGNGFAAYPDFATALLGGPNNGVNSQGFIGTILNNPAYAPFLKSGNLADFFNVYTPPGPQYGNPSMPELLSRYTNLRGNFPH